MQLLLPTWMQLLMILLLTMMTMVLLVRLLEQLVMMTLFQAVQLLMVLVVAAAAVAGSAATVATVVYSSSLAAAVAAAAAAVAGNSDGPAVLPIAEGRCWLHRSHSGRLVKVAPSDRTHLLSNHQPPDKNPIGQNPSSIQTPSDKNPIGRSNSGTGCLTNTILLSPCYRCDPFETDQKACCDGPLTQNISVMEGPNRQGAIRVYSRYPYSYRVPLLQDSNRTV